MSKFNRLLPPLHPPGNGRMGIEQPAPSGDAVSGSLTFFRRTSPPSPALHLAG